MSDKQEQIYPAFRLVAEFADGQRLTFDGFTWRQARDAMEEAQIEHGDITWSDGVTDGHYENGRYYAAVLPPPDDLFPDPDPSVSDLGQQSLF